MSAAVVLLWAGVAAAEASAGAALDSWARSRGVVLEAPAGSPPLPAAGHDDGFADHAEERLAEALALASAGDAAESTAALAALRAELLARPELPEAPWLLHEVDRALGEGSAPPDPAPTGATLPPRARAAGAGEASDEWYVDAERAPGPPPPGAVHHVRVLRGGALLAAGWVGPGRPALALPAPRACSAADLAAALAGPGARPLARGVACRDFAIAREAPGGGVEIARCREGSCTGFLPWRAAWGRGFEGPAQRQRPSRGGGAGLWVAGAALLVSGAAFATWVALRPDDRGEAPPPFRYVPPER